MIFHAASLRRRCSAALGAAHAAALAALPVATFAGMFVAAPAPPPPEIDTRPEIVAASTGGRIVIVQFPERGTFARSSGGTATPISFSARDLRGPGPCSHYERIDEEDAYDPDRRADCENFMRVELQTFAARDLANAKYESARQASKFFFERSNERSGIFNAFASGGSLRAQIETPDPVLGRVRLLAVTNSGESLIAAESLRQGDNNVLMWRTTITRYDPRGRPLGNARVADTDGRLVYGDYLVANESGEIGLLRMEGDTITVEWRSFAPAPATPAPPMGVRIEGENAPRVSRGFDYVEFARLSEKMDGDDAPTNREITRAEVIAHAQNYLHARWKLGSVNHSPPGMLSECRPEARRTWLRPRSLDNLGGKEVEGIPYKWGGFVTLDKFSARIAAGSMAGNACACGDPALLYCVLDKATGIDATGFVSRVWGTSRQTTLTLETLSTPIAFAELKRGDILVRSGEHARVFLETIFGHAEFGVRVVESSVACGGVCERILTARELDGYTPRRYLKIRD